jgi:hypothetical protein
MHSRCFVLLLAYEMSIQIYISILLCIISVKCFSMEVQLCLQIQKLKSKSAGNLICFLDWNYMNNNSQ